MMLAVATTLATVLLPGAFAIPDATRTAMHRALQSAKDAHASGSISYGDGLSAAVSAGLGADLAAATTVDANGGHHLWFRSTDPVLGWCGEVDAAPYMPAEIFQPQHFLSLLAYAHVTTSLYSYPDYSNGTPSRATPLVAGRCSGIDYNRYNGVLSGISWFGADGLMGPVCAERCGCNFEGQSNLHLPACEDGPDDPSTGSFCSLCGPTTGCPGCVTAREQFLLLLLALRFSSCNAAVLLLLLLPPSQPGAAALCAPTGFREDDSTANRQSSGVNTNAFEYDESLNTVGNIYLFREGAAECLPRGCACQTRPETGPNPVPAWRISPALCQSQRPDGH